MRDPAAADVEHVTPRFDLALVVRRQRGDRALINMIDQARLLGGIELRVVVLVEALEIIFRERRRRGPVCGVDEDAGRDVLVPRQI